jgi:molybdopterin-containing oxidoreductase family membrane subunit
MLKEIISLLSFLMTARNIILLLLILVSIAGGIWGLYGVYQVFAKGHGLAMNTTSYVPWGIQISTYIFLVLVSTGCTFATFFGHMSSPRTYAVVAPRVIALALLTVLGGLGALLFEIGWPTRFMNWLTSPSFTSPMAWMFYFYAIYIVAITLEYFLLKFAPHSALSKAVMWVAFISAVVTHSTLGAIFGIVEAIPYYYGSLVPIFFLAVAFLCGSALASILAYLSGVKYRGALPPLRTMVGVSIGIVFALSIWRFIVGSTSGAEGYEIFQMTAQKFWALNIFIGLVIPFTLVLVSLLKGLGWLLPIGSVIILITQFISRYNFVIDGFRMPQFRGILTPDVIAYSPSSTEISIVIGAFAFVVFSYSIADLTGILEPRHIEEESRHE